MAKAIDGFKEFITQGNAVDLAVGVVIGAAFGKVVDAVVDGILNPLIGGLFGQPNLDKIWTISLGEASIRPGYILTALINFVLVAAAIYFFVVVPINKLRSLRKPVDAPPAPKADDVVLLEQIRDLLAEKKA